MIGSHKSIPNNEMTTIIINLSTPRLSSCSNDSAAGSILSASRLGDDLDIKLHIIKIVSIYLQKIIISSTITDIVLEDTTNYLLTQLFLIGLRKFIKSVPPVPFPPAA
jgi:hypothetical protein